MSTKPGEGERRAASGYRPQYLLGAKVILEALKQGDLEWVRVADPDAGKVDDLQIGTTARVDAYQVKWAQYGGTVTLKNLVDGTKEEESLITQLAKGWQSLQKLYPHRRVVVHLATNRYPSTSTQGMPQVSSPPTPYHLAAFIEQAWNPAHQTGRLESGNWDTVWKSIRLASGLSIDEFSMFVQDCSLDFQAVLTSDNADVKGVADLLFDTAAGAERRVEISQGELLQRLGWRNRYTYRNVHEFPAPQFLYRPIHSTVKAIEAALSLLPSGYIGVFGSPGSGKSTLLTQTLRALPIRLIRYYAYVPDAHDPSVLRGESTNFLQDVTLRLSEAGFCRTNRPDASDRAALLKLLHEQLQELGNDYQQTSTKTVILIDGLDHVAREQHPERSFLHDLPLPEAIPFGVYLVIGSQLNGLTDLPPRVARILQEQERTIEMGCLSPADVRPIAEEAVPGLNEDEQKRIFELSSGHPLALIYLLKQLRQTTQSGERTRLLEETLPYTGDIDEQYWTHWRRIEDDEPLVHTLGLLARVRGVIPFTRVPQWAEKATLRKLDQLFLTTYFQAEGEDCWVFFHNSFRLFLEKQTAEPLPGQTRKQQDQEYHRELADRYRTSSAPWQWETLYHLYKAGDYTAVVAMANQAWFRKQVENFRPYQSIWTDIRLAFKAAGECQDVITLLQLTLAGAAIDQRVNELDDFPDLLLEVGEFAEAIEHLRDGNRLCTNAEQALRLSVRLHEAGLVSEGRRIFELAEPLELLSGRPISNDNSRPTNLKDLLWSWVRSALVFRGCKEVVKVIQRIRIEPERPTSEGIDSEQLSRRLQAGLLFQGVLACCDHDNWEGWQILFDALDEQSDRRMHFFALLRSAERAQEAGKTDHASTLLQQLLNTFQPQELDILAGAVQITEVRLDIAELILRVTNDKTLVQVWTWDLAPIPLQDKSTHREKSAIYELQFRYARLRYLLGNTSEPESLRDEAEAHTNFSPYVRENEKQSYRQHALTVFHLARLRAWAYSGFHLQPVMFLREVRWILDLIGPRFTEWAKPIDLEIGWSRSWILRCIVATAALHGETVLQELTQDFESRWTDGQEESSWSPYLQREAVVALIEAGASPIWAKAQLSRIEPIMLKNLSPRERAEACKAQAEAWLMLGERDAAIAELRRMMQAARGISDDKDYQLPNWVEWLRRINKLEPNRAEERTLLMLKRVLSIHGNASGVVDAAEELIGVMFKQSPRRAVHLLKGLLELHVIGYQGGVSRLLKEALDTEKPPIIEVLHTIVDLVLPFVTGDNSDLVKSLIVKTENQFGFDAALNAAGYLVERIRIDVLSKCRPAWHQGIAAGLQVIGCPPAQIGLQPIEMADPPNPSESSQLDRRLYLNSGEYLEPDEVLNRIQSISDLRTLIEEENQENTSYFRWEIVVEHLSQKLVSSAEIGELESIIKSQFSTDFFKRYKLAQMLLALSKRLSNLGNSSLAWNCAEQALVTTESTGWDSYFDGGTRYKVLKHLIAIDANQGRERAIKLYAEDGSKGLIRPERMLLELDKVLELLSSEVPVVNVWSAIEEYLDDLFAGVLIEPELPPEILGATQFNASEEDTPDRAVADLLSFHLDHPSYPVAQGAVRACTANLLQGSTAVIAALKEALTRTEQSAERALMVLDAASAEDPESIQAFDEILEQLRLSPNFLIRLIASCVQAQYKGEELILETVEREIPVVYTFELPLVSLHRTERAATREDASAVLMEDPALKLRPLDIEARAIAQIAQIAEDNIFYQAMQHFHELETKRSWLTRKKALDQEQVSQFLDKIGLLHTFQKPHIASARQALAYVVAELYDGGYFPLGALRQLSHVLIYHDPAFILYRAQHRPSCVAAIGGIAANEQTFIRLPENWIESASDSLSLLSSRAFDRRIVLGEWTQLRYLDDKSPEEERISVVRATNSEHLWDEFDVEAGHRPFSRFIKYQTVEYLFLHESLDQLIIAGDGYSFDTPGSFWIAFNPVVAQALGWHPIDGGWFRWANQAGELVAESIWWGDGPLHQHSKHLYCEVGGGWLVLVTEQGFEEIRQWAGQLSRGGLIRRMLGHYGSDGQGSAIEVLALP
jgi:hypothetical protein